MKEQFSPPPRSMSIFSRMVILFGGFYSQFGGFFFGFGMIFFWVFVMNSAVVEWFDFRSYESTPGRMVRFEGTNASVNEEPIYAYIYSYEIDGETYEGQVYSRMGGYQINVDIQVEYVPDNPSVSKIKGGSKYIFPGWIIFVALFPITGLIMMYIGIKRNIKSLRLLQTGVFTRGKLKHKKATNTRINEQPVYQFFFEFEYAGQKFESTAKTHRTILLEDEVTERILFDPDFPEFSCLYDVIPFAPKIKSDGSLSQVPIYGGLFLVIPLGSLLAHGAWLWIWYIL